MPDPARKSTFFLRIFFLLCFVLAAYYAFPWAMKKINGLDKATNHAVLIYPDSAKYDPNPSACHDSWGCVNFDRNPNLPGALPVYPAKRLKHPTIIYRLAGVDPSSFLVSIDGSNEGSEENPHAEHTMIREGIEPIPHGAKVRVRFMGGALSNLYGHKTLWKVGMFQKRYGSDTHLYDQTSDGYFVDALLVRLATRSGRHTLGQKFCIMVAPNTPLGPKEQCGNYELEIKNELGEDAWPVFFNNSAWTWDSYLTGADTLVRDYFAKGAGLNGDRLNLLIRYVYKQ